MHRPDTIIEIHRERVQDQTVEMFGGDKYTESVDGPGYSATATLDLTLDRVWFVFDAQQRLWQVRESVAEVLGVYGPPLKFDVSLPLSAIEGFAADSADLVARHAPDAIPVLFGHIGEGNLRRFYFIEGP